jgi:biotin carboxyl carrier protein
MPKMRFIATLHGKEHVIIVDNHGRDDGAYTMSLDGRPYDVDAQLMKSHLVSVLIDNHSYDVDVEKSTDEPLDGRLAVRVRGRVVRFEMLDERRHKMKEAQSTRFELAGVAIVRSPMPGKVMKLLVKEGDAVEESVGVVVIEAMKMENELKAPKAGTVTSIIVKDGDTIESGAVLLVIE